MQRKDEISAIFKPENPFFFLMEPVIMQFVTVVDGGSGSCDHMDVIIITELCNANRNQPQHSLLAVGTY